MADILDILSRTDLSQPAIKKPESNGISQMLSRLINTASRDSVMEPGFMAGLTAPVNSPVGYSNIGNLTGSRLRTMFVDPAKKASMAIHKGMTGHPLTMNDAASITEILSEYAMGGGFLAKPNARTLHSITSVKPWPDDFPKAFNQTSVAAMKKHPGYKAGKAGDKREAISLVDELIKIEKTQQMGRQFPDAILVAPHAQEASGINQIPLQIANGISERTGLPVDANIVQSNKAYRTGKGAAEKMIARPEFDGDVIKGQEYILVDDVLSQGGTMSELRHYIENKGGKVVAVAPLTYARGSGILGVQNSTIKNLNERFGKNELEKLLQEFNVSGKTEAITEREGRYLLKFRSLDSIRNRLTQAKQERINSLGESLLQKTPSHVKKPHNQSGTPKGGVQ